MGLLGYVDIDQLAMRVPPGSAPDAKTRTKASNLADLLPNYAAEGAQQIVISGVALPAEVPLFERAVGPIEWVRLSANRDELRRRFTHRDGPEALADDAARYADELDLSDFAQVTVETTDTTPAEVARRIDDVTPRPPGDDHVPAKQPRDGRPGDGPRVVVVTGPRAVGTSSVGWQLLMMSRPASLTAFVDLAQVGFLNVGDDLTARHHRLRAANLAAMVRNYGQEGCQLVIAGGAVLNAEERDTYAAALAPGSMSVIRLHAATEELRRRVTARTALTGGPYLAGDDLRGGTDTEADRVFDQALREAHELDQGHELDNAHFADHTIDTTRRSANETAELIRHLPHH